MHELTCPSPSSTPAPGRHLSNIQVFEHGGWLTGSQPLWMLLEVAVTIGVRRRWGGLALSRHYVVSELAEHGGVWVRVLITTPLPAPRSSSGWVS